MKTFSDVFEEGGFLSDPFHEGFGMMTIHGVAKPVYRAYQLLHRTGKDRVAVTQVAGSNATAGVFVISNGPEIMAIVYNHNIPTNPIKTETVCLQFSGINLMGKSAVLERIDDTHSNPTAVWKSMGSPGYINSAQVT
jgi:xylan 1,4-beta-xylosidase